jgi:hypothetical protein
MPVYNVTKEQMIDISFGRAIDAQLAHDSLTGVAVYGSHVIATLEPVVRYGRELMQPTAVFIPQFQSEVQKEIGEWQ